MNRYRGFSLIEIMVVIVILGILASLVVPKIMTRPDQARRVKAQQDILAIQNALDLYKLDNGDYPTNEQGLKALVEKPTIEPIPTNWQSYLKHLPGDPWGRAYGYAYPGEHGEVDIWSDGPGKNQSDNQIIGNWNTP